MNDTTAQTNSGAADSRIEGGVDRMAQSAHSGVDAASDVAGPAIDQMAAGAHRAINSADEAATSAVAALEAAGVRGKALLDTSTTYMRQHPLLSLGVAVAAGFVLSRLLLK
jgi:ElaB/YqjD/DUF883 family membrane-anchored ribosome-binding protein